MRSPVSAAPPPARSSPRSGWTWVVSPPPAIWPPGPASPPGVKQSAGKTKGKNATGHGNPYLARVLGEAAAAAGRTDTFQGERYRRIARRRGANKAIVAVGRSILVIIWHLLADPTARFCDLGAGFYHTRVNADRAKRNYVRQLEALGYKVTLQPAA